MQSRDQLQVNTRGMMPQDFKDIEKEGKNYTVPSTGVFIPATTKKEIVRYYGNIADVEFGRPRSLSL
jgi:hypothetical protein